MITYNYSKPSGATYASVTTYLSASGMALDANGEAYLHVYGASNGGTALLTDLKNAKEEAAAVSYAQGFISTTDSECALLDVKSATWDTLKGGYEDLSTGTKKVFAETTTDTDILAFLARYDFIVAKYGYENFLGRSESSIKTVTEEGDMTGMYVLVAAIGASALAFGTFMALRKRKKA